MYRYVISVTDIEYGVTAFRTTIESEYDLTESYENGDWDPTDEVAEKFEDYDYEMHRVSYEPA